MRGLPASGAAAQDLCIPMKRRGHTEVYADHGRVHRGFGFLGAIQVLRLEETELPHVHMDTARERVITGMQADVEHSACKCVISRPQPQHRPVWMQQPGVDSKPRPPTEVSDVMESVECGKIAPDRFLIDQSV